MNNDYEDFKDRLMQQHSEKSKKELEDEALSKLQELEDIIAVIQLKAFPSINEEDLTQSVYHVLQDTLLTKFINGRATLDKRMNVVTGHLEQFRNENEKEREFLIESDFETIKKTYGFHDRGNKEQ